MQLKKGDLFFTVTIPGKVGIKKNGRKQIRDSYGRVRNVPSERYSNWEKVAIPFINQAIVKSPNKLSWPFRWPIHAEFEFYFKNKKALPDTSNCIEGPQDAMEYCRVYDNDRLIESISAKRFITGEEKTVIRLFELTEVEL